MTWPVRDKLFFSLSCRSKLRVTVVGFACAIGQPECVKEAGDRFDKWLSNSTIRPTPDIRSIVYYYGMKANGNEQNWEAVWNLYLKETDASEKVKLMSALSAVQNPTLLTRYVRSIWFIRNQFYIKY